MFKFLKRLFRKRVKMVYSLLGGIIEDNSEDLYQKDTYKARITTRTFFTNLRVYVFKNDRNPFNQIEDVVTKNEDGSFTVEVKTDKSFDKLVIVTESENIEPDYKLDVVPRNYHIPPAGGVIEFIASAENYNSKDNPEMFTITVKSEAIEGRYWNYENNKIFAILAPKDPSVDLTGDVIVKYKHRSTRTHVYQDRE